MKKEVLNSVIRIVGKYESHRSDLLDALYDELKLLDSRIEVKSYYNMVEIISEYDEKAAEYLRTDALNLKGFEFSGSLKRAFSWCDTPQDYDYWFDLNDYLNQYR